MSLLINGNKDLKKYSSVSVYLKAGSVPKIAVQGKPVSVTTDSYSVTVETDSSLAIFDSKDVVSVVFS